MLRQSEVTPPGPAIARVSVAMTRQRATTHPHQRRSDPVRKPGNWLATRGHDTCVRPRSIRAMPSFQWRQISSPECPN